MAYSLTINGLTVPVSGFARPTDLTDLLARGPFRGSNFKAHGVTGSTHRQKVRDELPALVPLEVQGQKTSAGAARAEPLWSGIRANIDELYDTWVDPSASAPVTCTVTYPDGATRTGQVEVPRLVPGLSGENRLGTFVTVVAEIVVLAGRLVAP